ncbi:MAG: aspartyl protease family protein [Pseudomonadota bacterium]
MVARRLLRDAPALVLAAAVFATWAEEPEQPLPTVSPGNVGEIVVEAPEPRYVAPTLRDRIGRIWAPVLINDQGPFRLVLDTGATSSAVSAKVAATLGLPPEANSSVNLRGVTGTRVVPTIKVDSIVVGDLELHFKRVPIIYDALGGADGILGTEGLQDKRLFIDFRHDKIRISRSHADPPQPGFLTVPVQIVGGLLLVADVKIGAVHAKAIIDTGGQGTLANEAFRDALVRHLKSADIAADEVTGATMDVQRGDRVITPPIELGGVTIRGAHFTAGDLYIFQHWKMTKEPAVLIGMDVLGRLDTLIIDYKRRELQVKLRDD